MLTLLCIGILILVLAGGVTLHAALTAPEGFEDHLGFHVASLRGEGASAAANAGQGVTAVARKMPPLAAAR